MTRPIIIKNKINNFNKTIKVAGDKSISIRWVLLSSLASGCLKQKFTFIWRCIAAINKLGIKSKIKNNECKIYGKGINGYKYKKSCY